MATTTQKQAARRNIAKAWDHPMSAEGSLPVGVHRIPSAHFGATLRGVV